MHALRKWLLSGLLVIVPLVITLGVLNWIIGTLDQTLWLLPAAVAELARRAPGARPGRAADAGDPAGRSAPSPATSSASACWAGATRWCAASRWCARSIPASSRCPTRCFPRTAMPSAPRCWSQWPRQGVWTIAFVTGTPGGDVVEPPGRRRLPERLRADHAEPHRRLLRDAQAQRLHRTQDERGRRAQVHRLDGRGRSRRPRRPLAIRISRRASSAPESIYGHAFPLLRSRDRSPARPNRHPVRLGQPPARPRRRDLHRPARPRRLRAGGVRPRPRRHLRHRREPAQRVLRAGHGPGARAPRRHGQRQPQERQDRGAVPRAEGAQPLGHAAVPARRRQPVGNHPPDAPRARPAPPGDAAAT